MEEVKRFLESAEPGNGLDKIIFVVFSSNDEFVYKSLLPVYFPPTKGNTSPNILAEQPAQVEESSLLSIPVPTDQPSPSISGEETTRSVRFGKQPVKSRGWNDDETKTLMDFELHVGTCKVCGNGLYERNQRLCEPGFHLAEAVTQRTEMSEDALVYSKADEQGQREQLEMPVEQLPSTMLLLSTVAKDRRYNPFAQVEKPDTTASNTPISWHTLVPNDPDNIAQATDQPAVVRVEVLSPHTDTGDWFYSWVRVFRSKIEMYSGDYDPDPYGESTGHTPYASIDLTDTTTNVDGGKGMIVSLWTVPQGPDQGETWHFRSSEVTDSIALLELFKRAINRGRQEREKKITAEVEETTGPEATIASESGRDVLEDPFAGVNKPGAVKLDDQTQTENKAQEEEEGDDWGLSSIWGGGKKMKKSSTYSSKAEDTTVVAPDAGPRAVIRVEALASRGASDWTNAILYVYEGKIVVEFEKNDGPDQPYATIDLTNGLPHLGREGNGPEIDHVNMACLQVTRRGEWARPSLLPRETWYFRSDGESDTGAMFSVLQEAVDRNRKVEKKTASTEVEETTSPGPTTAPIAQREETGEALDALSYSEWNQRLRDIKDQADDKHRTKEENVPAYNAPADSTSNSGSASADLEPESAKPDLGARILTYLDNDFKTRPGSYIGQNFNEIALALEHWHRPFIAHALSRLAANGRVHNTVDDETWVISKPYTKLRTSDQEDQPEKPSETGTDGLADQVLIYMNRVGGRTLLLSMVKEFQTSTDALWPAIRYLKTSEFISSQAGDQIWILTDEGRTRVRELQAKSAEAGNDIAQVTGTTPDARPTPSRYWSFSELQNLEINVARFGTDWTAMANHIGTKTPTMLEDEYLRSVKRGNLAMEQLAKEADARNALASQQLATESLESMNQPTSDEDNAVAEKRGDSKAEPEKDSNQDEDTPNNLADRALSYLRSLPGVSENISDLATTFDTPVTELQPVLEQLGSDGLVRNAEDKSTWTATVPTQYSRSRSTRAGLTPHSPIAKSDVLPRSGGGYNMYPCPNWQEKGHPSNYNYIDEKDLLCGHCIQAQKREDTSTENATHDDNTSTTHIQLTGSGSSIMDAAIQRGEIDISTVTTYEGIPDSITRTRTRIKSSLVDERVLAQAGFRPDLNHPGDYVLVREVRPEEVEEWVRRTKELRGKDSQVPTVTLTESENLVVHGTLPQSTPMSGSAHVPADDSQASPSQNDVSELAITDAEIHSNTSKVRAPYKTSAKPGAYWTRIRQRLVDARVLDEEDEAFEVRGDSLFLPRVPRRREIRVWAEKTRSFRREQGESESRPEEGGIQCYPSRTTSPEGKNTDEASMSSEAEPALQPTAESPNTSQAGSWRDGRGAKERKQTKSNRALTDDIEEDMEPGTASRLRRMKSARERKHNASSKAKKDDIDDELEDYDGQEEDFVDNEAPH